jgi:enamine deaminase RidA (YjgF/YER057c/UK114 family)
MPPSLPDSTQIGFSHGIRSGNLLFIAGELGVGPPGAESNFETQTRRAFANVQAVLETAGGTLADLVSTTTFVVDPSYFGEYLRLRREILGPSLPTGALVSVNQLARPEALVEIQAIAVLRCQ